MVNNKKKSSHTCYIFSLKKFLELTLKDMVFQQLDFILIKVKPILIYLVSSEAQERWGRLKNELLPLKCTDGAKIDGDLNSEYAISTRNHLKLFLLLLLFNDLESENENKECQFGFSLSLKKKKIT